MFQTVDEIWDFLNEQLLYAVQMLNELWESISESMEISEAEADYPEDETKPKPLDFSRSAPGRFLWPLTPWYTSGFT